MSEIKVETPSGTFLGYSNTDGHSIFSGIRFAHAQRWQPPVDIERYESPVNATSFGAVSPQVPGFLEQMLGDGDLNTSEDCLFLNIFRPTDVSETSNLPVLFWIHGGAYTNGSGSVAWYDGSHLASRGTIVVTINYRLGAFGFAGTGNYGILDMLSALRWVKRNISSFGGNPDNVTIFGESAGGSAVVSLMATASANVLFHKAWAMSPSIGQLRNMERAQELSDQFLEILDVSTLDGASQFPMEQILNAQTTAVNIPSDRFDVFAPTGGGAEVASDIIETASQCPIPFVVGTNRDENKLWSAFDTDAATHGHAEWEAHTKKIFGTKDAQARLTYEKFRPNEPVRELISAVNTDVSFRQPAQNLAEKRTQEKNPTWMYWFTWATPAFGGILGSCHALDIPFAFDNLQAPGTDILLGTEENRYVLATRFAEEIALFATHGHPSWEQFNTHGRPTLKLDIHAELMSDPESEIRELFTR